MLAGSRRSRRLFGIVAVGALALAACGDDDEPAAAPTTVEDPAPVDETPPAETPDETDPEPEPTEPEPTETTPDEPGTGTIDMDERSGEIILTDDEMATLAEIADGKLVGIVAATMATDYHRTLNESVKARAEELGFTAEIFDSREDPSQQLQGIEGFMSKNASAIIVTGLGGETIGPIAAEAAERGIFVVQVAGRNLMDIGAVTVSVEEEAMATAVGIAAGEYAQENYGGETIKMVITDYPSIELLVTRADMIEEIFLENYPQGEFIQRILGGTAENGVTSMETALQAHPDIVGVLGINDAGNLGAYQALDNAGRGSDDVFIFGLDCEEQAVDLIDSGTMYKGCVETNSVGTGQLALDAFAKWLAGGTVPGIIEVPVSVYMGS